VCHVVSTAVSPPEDGDGGTQEKVMVSASCRAAVVASASRVVVEALFLIEEKGDGAHVGASLNGLLLDGLKGGHVVGYTCCRAAAVSVGASLAASSSAIERVGWCRLATLKRGRVVASPRGERKRTTATRSSHVCTQQSPIVWTSH
jgi:hypothetical protein